MEFVYMYIKVVLLGIILISLCWLYLERLPFYKGAYLSFYGVVICAVTVYPIIIYVLYTIAVMAVGVERIRGTKSFDE